MKNKTISDFLKEIAFYLNLENQNAFRIKSYIKAAASVDELDIPLEGIVASGELSSLKGIDECIHPLINESMTGSLPAILKEYRKKYSSSVFQLLKIPGLDEKKIKTLYLEHNIDSIDALLSSIKKNELAGIPGFGEKLQERILNGIDYINDCSHFHLFEDAMEEAYILFEMFSECSKEINVSGSLRRNAELISYIDLIIIPSNIIKVKKILKENFVSTIKTVDGKKQTTFVTRNDFNVRIHITNELSFPFILLKTTGNEAHYDQLLAIAGQKGLRMDEFGMYEGDQCIKTETEEDIYRNLGIPQFIPPELREGWGEIEYALKNNLPELVKEIDIKGIFHIHSNFSDGAHSLEQLVKKGIQHGFEYIGISDHSQSADYAGGLSEERIIEQRNEIRHLNSKYKGQIRIFFGIESDIRDNGDLDYEANVLELFDFVIASVHSNYSMTEAEMTERIVKAVNNPYTTFLGHPTGRLLTQRPGYKVNIPKIISACSKSGTGIEINSNPYRLDISWRFLQYAKTKQIPIFISPDAHHMDAFDFFRLGVGIARKGMLEKSDVMNTRNAVEIEKYLKSRRDGR